MPSVTVGDTSIPYTIRRSPRARRLRLVVAPGRVEVVAPSRLSARQIEAFVHAKRRWLHEKTRALRERALDSMPERYVSGTSILFRGRFRRLWVDSAATTEPSLRYASAFHVTVPSEVTGAEREALVRDLVVGWLRSRAHEEALEIVRRYAERLGAAPKRIRIGNQKTLWGSCSSRGTISLNWRLMAAPKPIYEYVVVHELCHLRERNHGPRFWRLVGTLMPDYRERRAWLKKHGVALG